jgi:hypothetical protein
MLFHNLETYEKNISKLWKFNLNGHGCYRQKKELIYCVEIQPDEIDDFNCITKKRYFFDWKEEKGQELSKLQRLDSREILGLVSFEYIPEEWRIHIRLLTVSKENKGNKKQYENIARNLITYVSKLAIKEYAELACVSLKLKESIARHYMVKYGMNKTGITLSVELPEILNLIKTYDHD